MPFGLHGALATFERLMDVGLKDCVWFATAYLEDVPIFLSEQINEPQIEQGMAQ